MAKQSVDKSSYKIALVALIVTAVVIGSIIYSNPTLFRSSADTSTISTSSSGSSTTHRPPSDYVCVRVVSDYNRTPLEGIEFHASPATAQNGTTTITTILLTEKTNSSGWACVQWTHSDVMILKTEYQGNVYNFSIPMSLGENYAVLSLPSGNVTTTTTSSPTTTSTTTTTSTSTEFNGTITASPPTEFNGPTLTNETSMLKLEATLSNISVNPGGYIWVRFNLTGPKEPEASYVELDVFNSQNQQVWGLAYRLGHTTQTPQPGPQGQLGTLVWWAVTDSHLKVNITPGTYTLIVRVTGENLTIKTTVNVVGPSTTTTSLTSNTTTTSALNSATTYTITKSSISVTCILTCTITSESAGADLRILSDSGSPIAGAQISGHEISGYQIVGTQTITCGNCNITSIATNSSGWVSLPGAVGPYNLTITYQGHLYNVNIPMYPVTLTEVTLHVPSGVFSVEVIPYGDRPVLSGPSFTSTSGGLQLNVTLSSFTVQAGSFQPIRVAFVGSGAWNASYAKVNVIVNNLAGENVWNYTGSMPTLYSIPYTNLLQEFICYTGWIPRTNNVPITPGEYILMLSVDVNGHLLRVQGTIRVIQ